MGCVCAKGINSDEVGGDPQRTKSLKRFVTLSRKDEVVAVIADVAISGSHGGTPRFLQNAVGELEKKSRVPAAADKVRRANVAHQRRVTMDATAHQDDGGGGRGLRNAAAETALGIVDVPNGFSGEHSVAGWPTWLTSVAGDAIKGWEPRRASSFEKLDKIGQGTYSSVYKAKDLETGKIVALKKVRFVNMDPESVRFMAREIQILRKLDHPNVIKLEGIITSRMSNNLYLVFQYMEHDLAGLAARPGVKFTEPQVKCYMRQLLEGLAHCHSHGILHRDIKGSNLLIDESGLLKIADFGLATPFSPDKKQQLTSRVVTLWYRPPELLLGATEYGVAVDLWSSGCILAELLAGKPIMPGRTEVEQLHKIFKLCGSPSDEYWKRSKLPHATIFKPQHQYKCCVADTFKDFPPSALALLDNLLAIEPQNRGTTVSALRSEFFTTKPFACDPSSLPKYPPSKEYDAKLRDEEKRRKKTEGATGRSESVRPGKRESKATADLDGSVNPRRRQGNSRATRDAYNAQLDSATVYPIDPPEVTGPSGFSQSGIHPSAFGSSWTKKANHNDHRPGRTYSSVRVENDLQLKSQRSFAPHSVNSDRFDASGSVAERNTENSRYNCLDVAEPSDKHTFDRPSSTHRKDGFRGTDYRTAYGTKNRRMHYSGPLITTGGNVEDMLKEHERQIQQAVRKAHLDKVKSKKDL